MDYSDGAGPLDVSCWLAICPMRSIILKNYMSVRTTMKYGVTYKFVLFPRSVLKTLNAKQYSDIIGKVEIVGKIYGCFFKSSWNCL